MTAAGSETTATAAIAAPRVRLEPDVLVARPIHGQVTHSGGPMLAPREPSFGTRLLKTWPALVIGLGIGATIAWTALLGWLAMHVAFLLL